MLKREQKLDGHCLSKVVWRPRHLKTGFGKSCLYFEVPMEYFVETWVSVFCLAV